MEPPIAVPDSHGCQLPQALVQGSLIPCLAPIAAAGAGHSRHPTGPPLTHLIADPEGLHHGSLLGRLYQFFRKASCSICLSSGRSATSCLSRRFSSSPSRRRRSSATP